MMVFKRRLDSGNEPPKSENYGSVRRRIPLKMFGKKFISKHLLVSSKVWMHTVPTHDCDIVLTLPASTSDTTLMWLLSHLRSRVPEISVLFRHHSHSGIYGLYMTASYESLLQGAEELGIRKPLKNEFGGGMKEFVLEDQECFEGVLEERSFLTSQERQSIVNHMLNNLRATDGEELGQLRFLEGQPIVPRLVSKNIVSGVFPLHHQDDLLYLQKAWVHSFLQKQPLDKISEYFGVKIGMYFAYLGHYTKWLVFPAFLGLILWLLPGTNQWWEDISWVLFSIFNVFWATLYIIHWKRTSASLSYRWGTLDRKDDYLKDPRPLFKGDVQRSPVTGHLEPYYPAWKRNLFRYGVSAPVITLCLCFVFYIMLALFQLQEWVNELVAAGDAPTFMRSVPKVLMAVVISLMDELYKQVAIWLNNKENHRLEETHETNLVIKLVLFVNSFLSLFYIAFYLKDMDRLRDTLAALLITRQILGNLKEVFIPFLKWQSRLYSVGYRIADQMSNRTFDREVEKVTEAYRRKLCDNSSNLMDNDSSRENDEHKPGLSQTSKATKQEEKGKDVPNDKALPSDDCSQALTQAEVESAMTTYDDAFEDYLEMCIQFGYVTLFSSAFPLAALCSWLNNLIEIRSDAFKLCYIHQRPFGVRVEDIGIWQDVLHVMVVIAVIVNSALIGMGDLVHRMVPDLSDAETIVLIVIVEHVILLITSALEYVIPDVPSEVALQMAKVEYARREALKRLETHSNADRAQRTRTPDSPIPGSSSPDSSGSTPHFHKPSPDIGSGSSANKHQSLVGHRPQNFNTNNKQDGIQRSGNPWGSAERGQANSSGNSTRTPDSTPGLRRLPSVPLDDRFQNPFESELQQVFRQPKKVQQIYRKNSDSSCISTVTIDKTHREGSTDGNCPRSSPALLYTRAKSFDAASFHFRSSSLPPLSAAKEARPAEQREAKSVHRTLPQPLSAPIDTIPLQSEKFSSGTESKLPQSKAIFSQEETASPCRENDLQSAVRRRGSQPVSSTPVSLLADKSGVEKSRQDKQTL